MKLSKVLLALVTEGARNVTLAAIGAPYTVTYYKVREGLRYVIHTRILPEPDAEAEELPDELECLLAQGEAYAPYINHFLSCDTHAPIVALELSDVHTCMEQAKVRYPHMTELTLEAIVVSMSTGMTMHEAVLTGLAHEKLVNKEPSKEEREYLDADLAGAATGDLVDPRSVTGVTLDYEPLARPLNADDRKALAVFYAERASRQTQPASLGSIVTKPMQMH